MGRISHQRRLAARFTSARLSTEAGTVFVPPRPLDLEAYFDADDTLATEYDTRLSAFERLVDAERYQLMLSLGWGRSSAPSRTLDLGLLRCDGDRLFVVHQLNDDAGTSLILAYLCGDVPSRLFRLFLVDYLSSGGTGYMVSLPCLLPERIWIVQPEVVPHAVVATGLLGLVTPGAVELSSAQPHAAHLPVRTSLVA